MEASVCLLASELGKKREERGGLKFEWSMYMAVAENIDGNSLAISIDDTTYHLPKE